ncbi:MAG: MFS transporter [bacterium]
MKIRSEMQAVRAGLRCSTIEAVFATIHLVLSQGVFLTNYVLDLGASNMVCGVVQALPFLAQFVFFLSPMLVRRIRYRKPVVLLFAVTHRAAWILLILLLYVDWSQSMRLAVMLCTLLLSNFCAVIAGNAWFSWMTDLVPPTVRGAYYGRRNAYMGLTSLITLFIGSQFLTVLRNAGCGNLGYTVCFSVAVLSAFFGAWMLGRQYEPPLRPVPPISMRVFLSAMASKPVFKSFVRFYVIWNFFLGFAGPFFGVYMVRVLHMSPALMGYQALIGSAMAFVGSRFWGRAIDRVGDRAVTLTSGALISIQVLLWLASRDGVLWPVWVSAVVGGFSWSGFGIVAFSWPQRMCGKEERQHTFGILGLFSGPAFMVGSLYGGFMTEILPDVLFTIGNFQVLNFHLLFAVSSLGRLTSVALITKWSFPHDLYARTLPRCIVDTFKTFSYTYRQR